MHRSQRKRMYDDSYLVSQQGREAPQPRPFHDDYKRQEKRRKTSKRSQDGNDRSQKPFIDYDEISSNSDESLSSPNRKAMKLKPLKLKPLKLKPLKLKSSTEYRHNSLITTTRYASSSTSRNSCQQDTRRGFSSRQRVKSPSTSLRMYSEDRIHSQIDDRDGSSHSRFLSPLKNNKKVMLKRSQCLSPTYDYADSSAGRHSRRGVNFHSPRSNLSAEFSSYDDLLNPSYKDIIRNKTHQRSPYGQ